MMLATHMTRPPAPFRGAALGADSITDVIVPPLSATAILWTLASLAAVGVSVYHGYKRNNSIGWAIAWGVAGGIAPIVTVPVALAQGFGKRKGG